MSVRPLRRVREGCHRSRDGRWTFMRHWSDPSPQRWFAYIDDDSYPCNEGEGHTRLTDAARWAAGPVGQRILADVDAEKEKE